MEVKLRYITRSKGARCGWARKPIYFDYHVWMLPGMASQYRKLHKTLTRKEVIVLLGKDLRVGQIVTRW